MLRLLILAVAFFWLGRLLKRVFLPSRPRERQARPPRPDTSERPRDSLRDLTQQEISDADFEEIPPEE